MDTLLIAAYGDIKTAKTTFGLSFPKPLVVFDLDQSYIRASMRYMAANPGLRSKIVTQVGQAPTPSPKRRRYYCYPVQDTSEYAWQAQGRAVGSMGEPDNP